MKKIVRDLLQAQEAYSYNLKRESSSDSKTGSYLLIRCLYRSKFEMTSIAFSKAGSRLDV
jgi:hypothetical protein